MLFAQTGAEATYGAYHNILGDTILFEEGERLQYRLKDDKKWRREKIGPVGEEGLTLGGATVKWDQLSGAKGYVKHSSKIMRYGMGKGFLIALIVILAFLAVILASGLLGGAPVYIILPKVVGLSMAFLIPYLIVFLLGPVIRYRRIKFGAKWRLIKVTPSTAKH